MKITNYSVKKPLAISAILLTFVILGIYSIFHISVNFLPKITYPVVKVQIRWAGATAEEIVTEIAEPLERIVSTVENLDYLESSSIEGLYTLTVYFLYGSDIDVAFQDVLATMTRAGRRLPEDIETPYIFKADPSQLPITQLILSSDTWDGIALRDWAENTFESIITSVPGVAGTEIIGGKIREIKVNLDMEALEKYKVSSSLISKRIKEENIEIAGGRITDNEKEILIRTASRFDSIKQLENIVVFQIQNQKVLLKDLAQVIDTNQEVRVITRHNTNECVKISVLKEASANTVQIVDRLNERIKNIKEFLPESIKLDYIEDQAIYVRQSLAGVANAAIAALVLLVIVIYLFLGSLKQVFVMFFSLPIILILNFGLMKFFDSSLNIFSLGGLVVALGVILDSSIVVIENITNKLSQKNEENNKDEVIIEATTEVGQAIVASTISFLALFFPFIFVEGLTSLLFRELIFVISGIVVISLFTALTVTPMISSHFLKNKKEKEKLSKFQIFFNNVEGRYKIILEKILNNKWKVIIAAVLITTGGVFLLGHTGGEFLPFMDDGRISIKVKMATGASVSETDKILKKIEENIKNEEIIDVMFTLSGGRIQGLATTEVANEGEVLIQLVAKKNRKVSTGEYVNMLRKKISNIQYPGARIMVRQAQIKGIMGNRGSDIVLKLRGQEMAVLNNIGQQVVQKLRESDFFQNVTFAVDSSKPEYKITIDRIKAAELGITATDIGTTVRTLIQGVSVSKFRDNNNYYDIMLGTESNRISDKKDIENLILYSSDGSFIRLKELAEVEFSTGPVEIIRENQSKQLTIDSDITGNNLSQAASELKKIMSSVNFPTGYEYDTGGKAQMMEDMRKTIIQVLLFAVFFSFAVLVVQFNSLKLPSIILFSIPVCLVGVIYILYFSNIPLGATVIIGILVVISSVVNDGVLLITTAESFLLKYKMSSVNAVVEAGVLRLRPRIMTTLTTMVGFLPIALNIEEGGDMLQPMALAAIGGLGFELFVALFLMPCIYVLYKK